MVRIHIAGLAICNPGASARYSILPRLAEVTEVGPEIGPGVAQIVADEDISVSVDGAVGYAVGRGNVRSPAAILEVLFAEVLLESAAGLIVLGLHRKSLLLPSGHLPSTTVYGVVVGAKCPVLTVRT